MSKHVTLREVEEDDLLTFFEHQRDAAANQMAAFPDRDKDTFMAHWAKIMQDESVTLKTILSMGRWLGTCSVLKSPASARLDTDWSESFGARESLHKRSPNC